MPMSPDSVVQPPWRRFQFGLKRFIVFVLVVGGTIGWFAHTVERKRRERAVVTLVQSAGGEVHYDWQLDPELHRPPGPGWLRNIVGDDYFAHVAHVDLRTKFDWDLSLVMGPAISMARQAAAEGSHRAAAKRRVPADELLRFVATLETVEALQLGETQVTDSGAKHIAKLENLSHLFLASNPVTDAGLAEIGRLGRLEMLDLRETDVTDAGMTQLAGLERLTWLRLRGTAVSDRGLAELAALEHLSYLDLRDTRVTRDGVRRLRAALPACRIAAWPVDER